MQDACERDKADLPPENLTAARADPGENPPLDQARRGGCSQTVCVHRSESIDNELTSTKEYEGLSRCEETMTHSALVDFKRLFFGCLCVSYLLVFFCDIQHLS